MNPNANPIRKTEGVHAEEFLFSEGEGSISRDTGTLTSGLKLKAGQPVSLTGGKFVASTGAVNTAGAIINPVVGILVHDTDASATGANADITGVAIISRLAEVVGATLQGYNSLGGTQKAAVTKSLLALNIIVR